MAATERLDPIVTWPPSAKGHHDAMAGAGEKELADCPRPAELGRPTFVLAGHPNLYLFVVGGGHTINRSCGGGDSDRGIRATGPQYQSDR